MEQTNFSDSTLMLKKILALSRQTKTMLLVVVGAAIMVGGWGWWYFFGRWPYNPDTDIGYLAALPDHSRTKIKLAGHVLSVEVVNTPTSVRQGLSDRDQIGSDGMLFILPAKTFQSFWMPRMHFDLDILWFSDQTLTQITPNVPAPLPNTPSHNLPLYPSHQPVNIVLELPSGRAQLLGLKVGAQFSL
jgi:uncharacterized membrane protein (UPF0127 family)